ncbi:MAG: glycosyltransferase [Ferruginibacter sp.]
MISVIIPARNEAKNLPVLFRSIELQDYPSELFEVLIIDDHSSDNSEHIFMEQAGIRNISFHRLKDHIPLLEINSYKKKAIEIGIQQSHGTLIVTTDADCIMPSSWLSTIASFYETFKPAFIAAPVVIKAHLSFIEIFQSLDFMTLQGITGASVHKNIHNMCNGANMAYEKSVFYDVNGFNGIDNIASGDDMLLMNKINKMYPNRTMFLKSAKAIVQTGSVKTVYEFFSQRIRWASKADSYDDKRIFSVLLVVYTFNCMLLILPITLIFREPGVSIFNFKFSIINFWLLSIVLKTTTEMIFLFPVSQFFKQQKLLFFFPLMQPFHILYTVIAGWMGKFGNYKWKDRNVK